MADISKISPDNGTTEYNLKDATARADIATLNGKIGAANGIASLNGSGKVPESQLPSYVDDVIEGYYYNGAFYSDSAHTTEITPETGKIYVDLTDNKTYRWSGSVYVCVGGEDPVWGGITGTLSNQTDLNTALSKKYDTDDTAETALADDDYVPFYDTSATAKKKTLWSNIKSVLKSYFDDIYSTYVSVLACIRATVGWASVNILKITAAEGETVLNDVSFYVTKNTAGEVLSISANGTASKNTLFEISSLVDDDGFGEIVNNQYILSGCPEGGSENTYSLYFEAGFDAFSDTGEGVLLNANGSSVIANGKVYIHIANGYTADRIYFYPMIRDKSIDDDTYRLYKGTVKDQLASKFDTSDTAETDLADADYVPFYDTSASGKKKSTWANIKAKLKAYFDTLYSTFSATDALLKDTVGWVGKNILKIPASVATQTIHGVTFTVTRNADGEVTEIDADGTASANAFFIIRPLGENLQTGNYILSGSPAMTGVRIQYDDQTTSKTYNDNGSGVNIPIVNGNNARFVIIISSGTTLNHVKFYPMLRDASIADPAYEPYHKSVEQTLRDAEVIEGKNRLENKATSTGIFTVNADKTVTVNSNASSDVTLDINSKITISESMILSGCPSGGSGSKYQLVAKIGSTYLTDSGSGVELSSGTYRIYILVKSGYGNGLVFKPMLCTKEEWDKSHDFEPFYIPLKDSKFDRAEQSVLGAKNILPYPYKASTKTENGLTFTDNGDGTITINGTATANTTFSLDTKGTSQAGFLRKFAGKPIKICGGHSENKRIEIWSTNIGYPINYSSMGDTVVVTLPSSIATDSYDIRIRIQSGETCNDEIFYPQFLLPSDPDDTYAPYAMTNRELTEVKEGAFTSVVGTATSDCYIRKQSNVVDINLCLNDVTSAANGSIATIPVGFRPPINNINLLCYDSTDNTVVRCIVGQDGIIHNKPSVSGGNLRLHATWITS